MFSVLFEGFNIEDLKKSLKSLKPDNYFYTNVVTLLQALPQNLKSDEVSVRYTMNKLSDENILRICELKKFFYPDFQKVAFLNEYNKQKSLCACVKLKDLAICGSDIISLGVEKGPKIGEIMEELLKAVIENKCHNEKNALIRYALELL